MTSVRVADAEVAVRLTSGGQDFVYAEFIPDTEGLDFSNAAAVGGAALIILPGMCEVASVIIAVDREDYVLTCQVSEGRCTRCGKPARWSWARRAHRHDECNGAGA